MVSLTLSWYNNLVILHSMFENNENTRQPKVNIFILFIYCLKLINFT